MSFCMRRPNNTLLVYWAQVTVKPGEGLLDEFISGWDVVGFVQLQLLVVLRSSQKVKHWLAQCLMQKNRVVLSIQHQGGYFDARNVIDLLYLGSCRNGDEATAHQNACLQPILHRRDHRSHPCAPTHSIIG